jgi:acetyl esterase/lipase
MRNFSITIVLLSLILIVFTAQSQHIEMPLWGKVIPNYQETDEQETRVQKDILKITNVKKPGIEVFLPSERNRNGQVVIVCPGGGYTILCYDWEGTDVAKWLNSQGIVAVVLKYRLPMAKSNIESHKSPILDAQRAVRLVRHNAEKWGVDTNRIGVMGFSAGGHLASTLATHYKDSYAEATDTIDKLSARPDFSILVYPVVTFKSNYTDNGSRNKLLHFNLDEKLINHFSNELHVTSETPPTFIMHSSNDSIVPVQNSLQYYQELVENKVEAEMHIYPIGGHGYALALDNNYLSRWTSHLEAWLKRH